MGSISKLSNLNPTYSPSTFNPKSCQPTVFLIKGFNGKTVFDQRVSSSRLTLRNNHASWGSLAVRCSSLAGNGSPTKRTVLHDLYEKEGQSPWYDNLCRPVTDLVPLIASGVRGVTSNPAIFQKAISTSNAYNEQFRELVQAGKDIESAYWELVVKDIQDACELFEPIYNETDGGDGYVSVEVSPRLADDTVGTVEAAKWLRKVVDRPNVYIKIPATAECVPSIKEVISLGISVNVTLIFSLARYEAVIDAYLDGLEASGLSDLSRVTSVASFFVSRVDTLVDKMLEKIGTPEALDLRGKAANAQAALAYKLYQKKFSGPRWEALVKKGAKKQRLLWASTSVKNPAYSDTLYVAPLIGPDTVSTMPDQALQAFIDHGAVSRTIDSNVSEAEGIYSALEKLGIDWGYVGSQLELEGVDSFKKSFDSLLDSLQEKANSLKLVSQQSKELNFGMASISAAGSLSVGKVNYCANVRPKPSRGFSEPAMRRIVGRYSNASSSSRICVPAIRGKDYGKTKMRYQDYTETESGLQYKDLRVGSGPTPKVGETVVVDWDGYTIGYYGRIFEARNKTKGGSFEGEDKEFYKFRVGSQQVIPAFEEAIAGMALGGIRRIVVPPELGYPDNDYNKSGPRPTTFSGQRALDFVLRNQGLIDKTLLFDIELLKIIPN
ncbi:hypothetical protein RHMOL_Rhmol12G0019700 [Rhododendron molle]|uniref:Uncharacterized protein n=2 Tax=Rhododendron molle TaxID=49168 RepID=A0ACC0LDN1_RHOML|nr:hypothetical protein RHMOL_Rhmol12G0019700 [Rhododendron molle]KAI8526745.1 hypothetical protein RHMOL_Rhmol12G0019700 [Rhododendron molle]